MKDRSSVAPDPSQTQDDEKIVSLQDVSPQSTILRSHPPKPEDTSTLYLSRTSTENKLVGGLDHTIVGVHIVLSPADDANGLWKEFHVKSGQKLSAAAQREHDAESDKKFTMATHSLTICCDTLELHGEFHVPEANITIYARKLVLASYQLSKTSPPVEPCINTSPLAWDVPAAPGTTKTPGENGAHGRNAGSLQVFASSVESLDKSESKQIKLHAKGGPGQDPGSGRDGGPGIDVPCWSSYHFPRAGSSGFTHAFNPPAIYVTVDWSVVGFPTGHSYLGSKEWPQSGKDAITPGIPGNASDGGALLTNLKVGSYSLENDPGSAGKTPPKNYKGGRAGRPTRCAIYEVDRNWYLGYGYEDTTQGTGQQGPTHSTTNGKDARPSQPPAKQHGKKRGVEYVEFANAWVHPLSLQTFLEYAQDLFLAEAREDLADLLMNYDAALSLEMPKGDSWTTSPWTKGELKPQWLAAQTKVASMLQRLRAHLDYFGHSAGYTPLLSLPGSIQLFSSGTKGALRTMLLVDWVNEATRSAEQAIDQFDDLYKSMKEDSEDAANKVTAAESQISQLTKELGTLSQELEEIGSELKTLRRELLEKAEDNLTLQHMIKFGIKVAGAITQVIPVGQPALGEVGSLASIMGNLIGDDHVGLPDTVSKIGDVIDKTVETAKKAKASGVEGKADDPSLLVGKALDGLGPAVSMASQAISELQVPKSEVDAELEKLESDSPEMQSLLQKIRDLNDKKTKLFRALGGAFHTISDCYSRLSFNEAAIVHLQQQRAKKEDQINHDAQVFVNAIGERSHRNLLMYLYLMVKSYETTLLLNPDHVDRYWEQFRGPEKIRKLLEDAKQFEGQTLEQQAEALDEIFTQNINTIRIELLNNFSIEHTVQRSLVLSQTQSPNDMEVLNRGDELVIDPFALGLVDPMYHLARLNDADLTIEIDPDGPNLPAGYTLNVDLTPQQTGILRRGKDLVSVHSDDAAIYWNWTATGDSSGELETTKSPLSPGTKDVLDFILGEGSDKIRQQIVRPPLWSNLAIQVSYVPPLPDEKKPIIKTLNFKLRTDMTKAPADQRVLTVHSLGSSTGAIATCTDDLSNRGNGVGHFMRIYGINTEVQLKFELDAVHQSCFERWQMIGAEREESDDPKTATFTFNKQNVTANAYWTHSSNRVADLSGLLDSLTLEQVSNYAENHLNEESRKAFYSVVEARRSAQTWGAGCPIRIEADESASIVGLIPPGEGADDLPSDNNPEGWRQVNYKGICGWIRDSLPMRV